MQMLLFQIAQHIMNFKSLVGDAAESAPNYNIDDDTGWYSNIIKPIQNLLENIMTPLLILVGTAGSIYAIVLGVNYSRAEDTSKREEAKKRLINAVIGLVIMVALLIVLWLFTTYAADIVNFIRGQG